MEATMINLTPPSLASRLFVGMTERSDPEDYHLLIPVPFLGPARGRQVHGTTIQVVTTPPTTPFPATDALVTNCPRLALALSTADCTPVIIYDPTTAALGAAHAGWRGTYEGLLPQLIRVMQKRFGTKPENCVAVLGPAIAGPCYEVSPDLAEMFRTALPESRPAFIPGTNGRPRLDLRLVQRLQLRASGLLDDRMVTSEDCTHCDAKRFFSYRRDGPGTGRHWTVAMLLQ